MSAAYTEPPGMNRFWLGFLLGLGLPIVCTLLYYLFRFKNLPIGQYLDFLFQTGKIVHVLSLSVFPNLIPFMFFVRTDRYKSGRGIMAITIFYAILIFVLKLVM
jgi:hypothetical protein